MSINAPKAKIRNLVAIDFISKLWHRMRYHIVIREDIRERSLRRKDLQVAQPVEGRYDTSNSLLTELP